MRAGLSAKVREKILEALRISGVFAEFTGIFPEILQNVVVIGGFFCNNIVLYHGKIKARTKEYGTMDLQEKLAGLLLPEIDKTPGYYEALYPKRQQKEGTKVTRIAPSPTGYLHFGVLFAALVNRRVAGDDGVFYLRIEDTDKKREVENGAADIINGLLRFGIPIQEGFVAPGVEQGAYGPYQQSRRAEIYRCYAKELIRRGLAYPCFCTEAELAGLRAEQERQKADFGYYGKWARHRDMPYEEIEANLRAGKPFVVRLRSPGNPEKRIVFEDGIKGKIEMPENIEDVVILKSDGIPTYHFAHAVDDHLMRTTHVIRGDEWISSVPKHLQLFQALGFRAPKYAHISPIMKEEGGSRRKLSKRKDPEAAMRFYAEQGYPAESVTEYLLTIANSDFEDWRKINPTLPNTKFPFHLKKMSPSGALFDLIKLNDVSKNVISRMSTTEVLSLLLDWAREFDPDFYRLLNGDRGYAAGVFGIDRDVPKPRKDIAKWDEAKQYAAYFYDELFQPSYDLPENLDPRDAAAALRAYLPLYDPVDDREDWFAKIKEICPDLGFASETKEYKKNPEQYKGHAGDVSTMIRIAVTGRRNTPDLCSVMRLLGKERCAARIEAAAARWEA